MDSPFDNIDIIKIILGKFKDDPHNLLKLTHTSSFLRKEIIKNDIYPHIINIIKNNNIYQVKQIENKISNAINYKDSIKTILTNFISTGKEILNLKIKYNIEDPETLDFIKKQIRKEKNMLINITDYINNLNLRLESLRKKIFFFNQTFVELMFIPQPRQRLTGNYANGMIYYYMPYIPTTVNVDKIKLKYIVQDDNRDYKYIENLFFNKKSNMLHLTNCGSLKNSDLDNCVFIKKDDLIEYDEREFTYCKKCTRDIRNFLI